MLCFILFLYYFNRKLKFNNHNGNIYFSLEDCSLFENRSSYDANIILTLHNINDITCYYAKCKIEKKNFIFFIFFIFLLIIYLKKYIYIYIYI